MLKFMVVLYRRPDFSQEEFFRYLRTVHGPMAQRLPGLRHYIQNLVVADPARKHPGWDAVIELFWDDRATMEAAWRSPEGEAATNDLAPFADLTRTTWAIVEEVRVTPPNPLPSERSSGSPWDQ
jgi:uncharacterized protein (TIGR02118 family)